jgi:hypothetical protein
MVLQIDKRKYKAALALRGLRALDVARTLGVPPSTLASWINGVSPSPTGLEERLESALSLARHGLRADRAPEAA